MLVHVKAGRVKKTKNLRLNGLKLNSLPQIPSVQPYCTCKASFDPKGLLKRMIQYVYRNACKLRVVGLQKDWVSNTEQHYFELLSARYVIQYGPVLKIGE